MHVPLNYSSERGSAMHAGDRVKLKPHVAKTFSRDKQVDWTKRIGDVVSVGRTSVVIQWQDRKSLDHWPHNALVVVKPVSKS
jgi:hypothetical protein